MPAVPSKDSRSSKAPGASARKTARSKAGARPRRTATAEPRSAEASSESDRAEDASTVADLIHRMSRYLSDLTLEDLRRFGMTVPRWSVLTQLSVRDGRSIGDLARATVIKQSSLTRVVDQMERDGLVLRSPARDDHRVVEVWLTEEGQATYDEVVPIAVHRMNEALAGLREADLEQLRGVLEGVLGGSRPQR